MPIIEVSHLTKEYRLGAMQGLKQTLLNTAARLTGKKIEQRQLFKALDDVSFSIEPGEVVGITRSPLPHKAVVRPKSLAAPGNQVGRSLLSRENRKSVDPIDSLFHDRHVVRNQP